MIGCQYQTKNKHFFNFIKSSYQVYTFENTSPICLLSYVIHTNAIYLYARPSRSFLIEEKCRFLSNFSLNTAEVELPGEFLLPKHSHYYVRIARFMPRVEIVQKHNTAARRLYIRGHNGKVRLGVSIHKDKILGYKYIVKIVEFAWDYLLIVGT